ncbi:MAG: lysophospholipid acyltransferase family protein [Cycloclasticus sp.]
MSVSLFKPAFLKPKYWSSWLLVAFSFFLAKLPSSWQDSLARRLARRLAGVRNNRLRTIQENIARCFPEKTPDCQKALLQDNLYSSFLMVFDLVNMVWRTPQQMTENIRLVGEQYLQQAVADNKGVLLVTGHFTPVCQMFSQLGRLLDCYSVYRRMDNPLLEAQIYQRAMNKYSLELIHRKDIRDMLAKLADNGTVIIVPDQDFGLKRGCFIPFFGIQTATITTIPQYAKRANSQVLMFNAYRENGGCVMEFEPALENYPTGDDIADTQYWSDWLEAKIRLHPADYLWMHKRFKTRPEGEEAFYN